jgi:RimJ/RimL family protein N-acetyltransferase
MTTTTPRVIVTGTLVRLREKQIDDARRDYDWRRDPELARFDAARPLSMSYRTFVSTMSEDLQFTSAYRRSFAIEELAEGKHIGNVMYYGYDAMRREAELGITIGDRDYWSRGYGTDAVRQMLRYLFDERELNRVYLHTLSWNHRAQAAFRNAGFRHVKPVHRDGHDFEQMEIRREEMADLDGPPAAS